MKMLNRHSGKYIALVLACVGLVSTASAPLLAAGTARTVWLGASAEPYFLGSPQVRRELGLSHQVSVEIKRLLNKANLAGRGGLMTRQEAKNQQEVARATDVPALRRQAIGYLTSSQKHRLGQLSLQRAGYYLFNSTANPIAKYVGYTTAQQKKVNAVFDRSFKRYVRDVQALMRADQDWYGSLDRKKYAAKYAAHDRAYRRIGERRGRAELAVVNQVLTPTQKRKWKELLGKPFPINRITYDLDVMHLD